MPRSRTHADSRVTDPHGIPPVPSDVDTAVPRQRAGRPAHDPWDPAYVPDPRRPVAHHHPPDRFADEPRDGGWPDEQRYPDSFLADDPYTRHGGDAYARDTAEERPGGRRTRRPAAQRGRPRAPRRRRPERPPHADTFVGTPDGPGSEPHADTLVRPPDEPERGGGPRFTTVAIPVAIGSLVAVGIGAWARTSDATGVAVNIAGFSSAGAVKAWLATLALVFALVQLWTAMVMRGRIGSGPGARTAMVHRWSGRIAVLVTVPVAVQCLIAMGWSGATPRTLAHSLLGCAFYGAFVTKMLLLRRSGVPGWLIAVSGGLLMAVLAGIWLTSALWFFGTKGLTF